MAIWELFLTALSLSMDAFAVSVCKGLAAGKPKKRHYFAVGIWFGGFQALMPFLGYLAGYRFRQYIERIDHWVAFLLLFVIGANMIREAFSKDEEKQTNDFGIGTMFLMALATSIDAFAVGITLALLPDVRIFTAIAIIGAVTFVISALGLWIDSVFGDRFEKKAEIAGGVILVFLGVKILLEHLGFIAF